MKTKLLVFLGVMVGAVSLLIAFGATPAHAKGETYKWIDGNTIQASGGLYHKVSAAKGGVLNFPRTGSNFSVVSDGSCTITLTITVTIDNKKGHLDTQGCDDKAKDFDRDFTLESPEKGPSLDGSEINYATVNCVKEYDGGDNVTRCEAVKKCVVTAHKAKDECLSAWATCIVNHFTDGSISSADLKECSDKIGGGDVAGAVTPPATPAGNDKDKTSCAVTGIGWIICPVVTFIARIVDGAYGFVASLLAVQPLFTTGQTAGVYTAWSVGRNFANVGLVITFLVIVFSQMTGIGITNYGIKKMIPKLVLYAVLVNVSYWICAIGVDVSNILGSSVNQIFQGIKAGLALPNADDFGATGTGWTGIAGGVLAGTVGVSIALYVGLAALLPALIAALFAVVTVFLVLTFRQGILILFIASSPLWMAAGIFPGLENLAKKARKGFGVMLLINPAVGGLFGVSALASTIIMGAASGPYKLPIQMMGAAVEVVPLFSSAFFIKLGGGVLDRFGGLTNRLDKGPFDRMRKGAEGYRDKRQNIAKTRRLGGTNMFRTDQAQERIRGDGSSRFRRGAAKVIGATGAPASGLAVRNLNKEQQTANALKALAEAKQDYVADRISGGDTKYAQTIAGPTGNVERITAQAIAAKKNEIAEAVKNAQISANIPPGELGEMGRRLSEAIKNNDDIGARAMQNMLLTSGSAGLAQYRQTMTEEEGNIDPKTGAGRALRENLLDNHGGVKASANDLIQQAVSGAKMSEVSADPKSWTLSDSDLVHQKSASVELAIKSGAISDEQAVRIATNDELAQHLDPAVRKKIESMADAATRPTP